MLTARRPSGLGSLAIASLLLAGLGRGAAAQQSRTVDFEDVLRAGDNVRLAAPGLSIGDAFVTRVTADSLVVSSGGQQWSLGTDAIQRLDVRRKQTGRWAQRGALGGAGMGIVSNVFASGLCDTCGTSYWLAAAGGALVFGALGAAIGSRNFRWQQLVGTR